MRVYRTDKITMTISNCNECPNKTVMSYLDRMGIPGFAVVCGAIRTLGVDEDNNNVVCCPVLHRYAEGNYMPNCPLENI